MRWVTIGACAGLAVGCGGLGPAQLTAAPPKGMGGAAVTGSGGSGPGGSLATDGGLPASDAGAPATDAGLADAGPPACPPAPAQPDGGISFPPVTWAPPTAVPFSCDPLPTSFFFPRPEAAVPG
ncbi:MAG TPA: hypothetical protein VN962_10285, partial [Polyangia bacterium]|nr:hypothetical protein [Polyangia bacterium]